MRKTFETQLGLGITPIEKVQLPKKSRDELPAILRGLLWVFNLPELKAEILALLTQRLMAGKKATGCWGMDLWQILVIGIVRLGLNTDWDRMEYLTKADIFLRQVLGIATDIFAPAEGFSGRRMGENAAMFDEALLTEINAIITRYAVNRVFPVKKGNAQVAPIQLKADGFVVETDVHYPTDLNLLWDACRKAIDGIARLCTEKKLKGWRKSDAWKSRIKGDMRACSTRHTGKNADQNRLASIEKYLKTTYEFEAKLHSSMEQLRHMNLTIEERFQLDELDRWQVEIIRHLLLVERRHIGHEIIPHHEKRFSLFEPHTQLIKKGKANKPAEFGLPLYIASDQNGLILSHLILEPGETEKEKLIPLVSKVMATHGENSIASISTDKGAFTKDNYDLLALFIPNIILPKPGKKNAQETQREQEPKFRKLRRKHSAVESNINCLEHHGLDRCPDIGEPAFRRYVGLAILSCNLHTIGRELNRQAAKARNRRQKRAA